MKPSVGFLHSRENDIPEWIGKVNRFYPAAAQAEYRNGDVVIRCSPLLSFDRISPDGFWSLLAQSVGQFTIGDVLRKTA